MIRSRRFSLLSLCAGALLSSLACADVSADVAADVVVDGAYVREPVPGRNMSAAFMQIKNTGTEDKTLVSASAPWTERIELHTHIHENGMMKMRQIQSLPVPAGETVVLQPMGLHLMLFGLQQPLAQELPLTLCFAGGDCVDTTAVLRTPDH